MFNYLLRRLLLLPLTLFLIILVNFIIINLAPGDPTSYTSVGGDGASRQDNQSTASSLDDKYSQFREHYGLTLPILFNLWPSITKEELLERFQLMVQFEQGQTTASQTFKEDRDARILTSDQSRFVMPKLLAIAEDTTQSHKVRQLAVRFFVRGGTRQSLLGPNLTEEQKALNQHLSEENAFLYKQTVNSDDSTEVVNQKVNALRDWYEENKQNLRYEPTLKEQFFLFFNETRFSRYFCRVLTLDFGTLRNDNNKRVIDEVIKRFPISMTLSVFPLIVTFVLCQIFGFWMAFRHNQWQDKLLSILFLILFSIPIFVAVPFLIDKVVLYHHFPFTDTPIPLYGFSSPERIYDKLSSWGRLKDIAQHIAIPLLAILYGSLAAQSRLTRTAVLEIKQLDFIRTAKAKGLSTFDIAWKHIGRNVGIIVVTSLAGSLGVVLGGSLIVETLFEINGFGKFFYDAILNRDYNVIMFSSIAGSFLTLLGYLLADLAYAALDPRVSYD